MSADPDAGTGRAAGPGPGSGRESGPAADLYLTPRAAGRAQLTVKGSRFLAVCEPCRSRARAAELVRACERSHADATHVCWAWRLLDEPEPGEAWSDAGEPSGTAGVPIVGALRSAGLTNALGIVVRWFGGTRLGRGGLIRAYRRAMQAAVTAAEIGEEVPHATVELRAPAAMIGELHRLLAGTGAIYREQEVLDAEAGITVSLPARLVDTLEERLHDATRGRGILRRLPGLDGGDTPDEE